MLDIVRAAKELPGAGITATDPTTFAAVSLLLFLIAIFASYLPARRAMQVDPQVAIRTD